MGDNRWNQEAAEGRAEEPVQPIRVPPPKSTLTRLAEIALPLLKMSMAFAKTLPGHARDLADRIDLPRRLDQSRQWVEARNFPEKAGRLMTGLAEGGKQAVALSRQGAAGAQAKAAPVFAAARNRSLAMAQAMGSTISGRSAAFVETLAKHGAERRVRAATQKAKAQAAREPARTDALPPAPVPSELMRLLKEEGVAVEGMDVRQALPQSVHPRAVAAQGALPLFADEPDPLPPPPPRKEQVMQTPPAVAPDKPEPPLKAPAPAPVASRGAALKTLTSALFTSTGSTPFYRNRTFQMTIGATAFLAAAGAAALMVMQGGAANSSSGIVSSGNMDRAQVEAIVRDYILAHPEIIPEAMDRLQSKRMASIVDQHRTELETPFAGGWDGARNGDVVLVEFFDYACGYCRASLPDIERLLAEDKGLKVVYRELPILSEESGEAAKASLYAAKQGQYGSFHRALYAAGRPSKEGIDAAARKAGFDPAALKDATKASDISAEIENNMRLAQALQATGTPTWVVGDQVLSGAVGYDMLKEAIAKARLAR